ncbi:MAG: sigma-70 family RNA polymerase sigma factor [Acidobacteriaceae bacterium]|nr:sigma-70 family RNA polymerase sigma factor [Acidobacteriaceae bacterium]
MPFEKPALGRRATWGALPPSSDDSNLLASLSGDGSRELSILFDRYSAPVFGIANRVLRDRSEAEEVVQEAFLYLYERCQLFDPAKGSARSWILQIALSRALDRRSYLNRRGFYSGVDFGSLRESLPANTDLEREMDARLSRTYLEMALAELSDMQRRTIEFFYFGGLELREISQRLGEPLGNVRHHLYRGLNRLRRSESLLRLYDRRTARWARRHG